FRRHPESLKALQRESRKAQQLAHANVVAVYDFDRDGGNVFMVMELLEGRSLDRIIRDNEGSGVGIEKAMRLTRDMCRAMAYAHEQGVVHSDFKPANAFLTKDNVVKVFDFGIARAVKRTDAVSGSVTLFDPATLGALTPTYASCEMLEGLEPDPRDDVYAMACVAYELITGKHPFNRVSAVDARNKGLVPKRPRGLKRQQWRAIQHGLEFSRENRTASAQQFLNELIPRKARATVGVSVAAVVVVGIVVAGFLVPTYLAKRRERAVIDALATADGSRLDALVQQLRSLTAEQRATILLNEGARAGLIKAFEARIDAATEPNQPNADYPGALGLLGELQGFLPDSQAVDLVVLARPEAVGQIPHRQRERRDQPPERPLRRLPQARAAHPRPGAAEHRHGAAGHSQDRRPEPPPARPAAAGRVRRADQPGAAGGQHDARAGAGDGRPGLRFERPGARGPARSGAARRRPATAAGTAQVAGGFPGGLDRRQCRLRRHRCQAGAAGSAAGHCARQPRAGQRSAVGATRCQRPGCPSGEHRTACAGPRSHRPVRRSVADPFCRSAAAEARLRAWRFPGRAGSHRTDQDRDRHVAAIREGRRQLERAIRSCVAPADCIRVCQ